MEPKRHVEQFEVIEHHVTTTRRPISSSEALNYVPSTEVRRSSETFLTSGPKSDQMFRDEAERRLHGKSTIDDDFRYQLTGERDMSRDASFGIAGMSPLREHPILQSTPEQSYSASAINNYGYDLNEVHTNEGGAQIVQTYGAGNVFDDSIMHDRSLDTSLRPGAAFVGTSILNPILNASVSPGSHHTTFEMPQPQSILKNTDSSRQFHSSEDNSLTRKESYKRMQESQTEHTPVYAPSSNATMISRQSKSGHTTFSRVKQGANCCRSFAALCNDLAEDFKDAEKTPGLICGLLLILLFLILLMVLLVIFLSAAFSPYSISSFLMYPPTCHECARKNPGAPIYQDPSRLYVHINSPSEIDFEMVGNHPLKSNSYTLVDFTTGYVAVADHALTDKNGRHYNCFLMKIDREALPSMDVVMDAISKTHHEVHTETGWQEHWQFVVKPIDRLEATSKFHSTVNDCLNAKWFMLEHVVYTRDSSCSSCYDFCFPDYAVQRREKYYDDISLAVRRLNCFRHYVPEWINYSVESDETDGHWNYPRRPQETQRDSSSNWVAWTPISVVGRPDITDIRQEFHPIDN